MQNTRKTLYKRVYAFFIIAMITIMTYCTIMPERVYALEGATANMCSSVHNGIVKVMPLAEGAEPAGGGGSPDATGDKVYNSVVDLMVKWFKRLGFLVAFIGAIMFALAIKNNDAESKQSGLLTMIAGFAVAGLCIGVDMFNLKG